MVSGINTLVGHRAGHAQVTGNGNTFIGYIAGGANTSSFNTAVGSGAMQNSTGTQNTVMGNSTYNSSSATGNQNTLIGMGVASNLTTGSQNVAIGFNQSLPSATASGQLDIQNIIYGSGNTGSGSTVSTGNIGIGVASPLVSARLDVTSTTQGFLTPRMTTTQMNAISSPATGLEIYNTDDSCKRFYNGARWQIISKTSTYIPTYTSTANIASTVVSAITYTINGNMCTLAGEVEFGITTPTTSTELRISLPSYVTNNFTATSQGGTVTFNTGGTNVFQVMPVVGATTIAFTSPSPSLTTSYKYPFTISFRIL